MKENPLVRKVGIILCLAPFANFFYSSFLQRNTLWDTAKTISVVNWVLWGAALGAGLMMVKGKQKSWLFAFFLMAINVLYGIFTFKKNFAYGWFQPTASLAINVGFLIFIYRLEFHGAGLLKSVRGESQSPPKPQPEPETEAVVVKTTHKIHHLEQPYENVTPLRPTEEKFCLPVTRHVHIHFSGLGAWAELVEVNQSGIVVRLLGEESPEAIENKDVELILSENSILHLRCYDVFDDFYEFRFTHIGHDQLEQIKHLAVG